MKPAPLPNQFLAPPGLAGANVNGRSTALAQFHRGTIHCRGSKEEGKNKRALLRGSHGDLDKSAAIVKLFASLVRTGEGAEERIVSVVASCDMQVST